MSESDFSAGITAGGLVVGIFASIVTWASTMHFVREAAIERGHGEWRLVDGGPDVEWVWLEVEAH